MALDSAFGIASTFSFSTDYTRSLQSMLGLCSKNFAGVLASSITSVSTFIARTPLLPSSSESNHISIKDPTIMNTINQTWREERERQHNAAVAELQESYHSSLVQRRRGLSIGRVRDSLWEEAILQQDRWRTAPYSLLLRSDSSAAKSEVPPHPPSPTVLRIEQSGEDYPQQGCTPTTCSGESPPTLPASGSSSPKTRSWSGSWDTKSTSSTLFDEESSSVVPHSDSSSFSTPSTPATSVTSGKTSASQHHELNPTTRRSSSASSAPRPRIIMIMPDPEEPAKPPRKVAGKAKPQTKAKSKGSKGQFDRHRPSATCGLRRVWPAPKIEGGRRRGGQKGRR